MKKLGILWMLVFGLGFAFQACDNHKTYAEMKEEERDAIRRFIELRDFKVIDEEQFFAQDTVTNVEKNEYVLFQESGVYMQILNRGGGSLLEDGRHDILVRYEEEEITEDGTTDTLSLNTWTNYYPHPDEFVLTKTGNSFSGALAASGAMYGTHGSTSVPSAWMLVFDYITPGRKVSDRSHIRLIVPHSEGTITASQSVTPAYYDIKYQLAR